MRLLRLEEAKLLPRKILLCQAEIEYMGFKKFGYCSYWLETAGASWKLTDDSISRAMRIDYWGGIDTEGVNVALPLAVRPVSANPIEGTDKWIDISEYVGETLWIRKEALNLPYHFDRKNNNYQRSDIKYFLEEWEKTIPVYNKRVDLYGVKGHDSYSDEFDKALDEMLHHLDMNGYNYDLYKEDILQVSEDEVVWLTDILDDYGFEYQVSDSNI